MAGSRWGQVKWRGEVRLGDKSGRCGAAGLNRALGLGRQE